MAGSIRSKLRASGHGMLGTATIAPWRLVEPMRELRRCKGVPSPTLSAPTHADVCATNQSVRSYTMWICSFMQGRLW